MAAEESIQHAALTDELRTLAEAFRENVSAVTIKRKLKTFEAFEGCVAVDWLLQQSVVPVKAGPLLSPDAETAREKALALGDMLRRLNVFRHVAQEHPLQDNKELYQYLPEEAIGALPAPLPNEPLNCTFKWPSGTPARPPAEVVEELLGHVLALVEPYLCVTSPSHPNRSTPGAWLKPESAVALRGTPAYREFIAATAELQAVRLEGQTHDGRLCFYVNLHNLMMAHACVALDHPTGSLSRLAFMNKVVYEVGPLGAVSVATLEHALIRAAMKAPKAFGGSLVPKLSQTDPLRFYALMAEEPLVTFVLASTARTSPLMPGVLRQETLRAQMKEACETYLRENVRLVVGSKCFYLPKVLEWWLGDFVKTAVTGGLRQTVRVRNNHMLLLDWCAEQVENVRRPLGVLQGKGERFDVKFDGYDWRFGVFR